MSDSTANDVQADNSQTFLISVLMVLFMGLVGITFALSLLMHRSFVSTALYDAEKNNKPYAIVNDKLSADEQLTAQPEWINKENDQIKLPLSLAIQSVIKDY